MIRRYTEAELKEELSKLTIIADSREQVNEHVKKALDKMKVPYKIRKLETGDYSAMLGNLTLEQDVCIERKRNLDEICENFSIQRERFEREMLRAKACGTKLFLLIENGKWNDVFLGNYRSKLNPKALVAALLSWQVRYNLTIIFCEPENTGKIVYGILYYWAREVLTNG